MVCAAIQEYVSTVESKIFWEQLLKILVRVVRSLLKNSTYGQEIDKRIQNIQKCRAKFHTEAQKFQHYQLHAMERIEWDTNGIAHDTKQGVGALAESVVQLKIEADARHEMIIKKMGDATSALNSLQHILGDTMKNVECVLINNSSNNPCSRCLRGRTNPDFTT